MSDTPAVRLVTPDATPTAEDPHARPEAPAVEPLLLDMAGLSRLLCRSQASLYRDAAAGRLPAPVRLGGSVRWRYSELVAWTEAGCPSRREWDARRAAGNASNRARQTGR